MSDSTDLVNDDSPPDDSRNDLDDFEELNKDEANDYVEEDDEDFEDEDEEDADN